MITETLKRLSNNQKMQLMEELWAELSNVLELESPQWHKSILEERMHSYKKGNLNTMSLDEAKIKLLKEFEKKH
ncbi:hypothetical protein EP331_06775 [bacterium]|nr:MAG: hypothetical protein EP331_06775 [bacterium]